MEDILFQIIITSLLVLMPLFGPVHKRKPTDIVSQSEIHSIYGINENGKLEIMNRDDEAAA